MLPLLIIEPGPMIARWVGALARIAFGLVLLRPACDWPLQPMPSSPPAPARATGTPCADRAGEIRRITVPSSVYGAPVPVSVYLPPCYAAFRDRLPVVYLLHGGNADETQWPDVGVASEADALIVQGVTPFVVVMPGGDYHSSLDYAAFVMDDLLPGVEEQLRVSTVRADRAIGGISLGGYWALRLAFKHPEVFAAVGGHSPVVNLGQRNDPQALAATATGLDQLLVSLDVGDADGLRAGTARLAQVLETRGLAVTFAVHSGRHDRVYWRSRTGAYLQFYLDAIAGSSFTRLPGAEWDSEGIVNLIHSQGLRLADSTHGRTISGCLGGICRIKQPCVRPLSCWRPRSVPAAPHASVLHQGDHGGDKSAHKLDPGQPEILGRGPLI